MFSKATPFHKGRQVPRLRPLRPIRSIDDALAQKLDTVRQLGDILVDQLPCFQHGAPGQMLRATRLLDKAGRLLTRVLRELDER